MYPLLPIDQPGYIPPAYSVGHEKPISTSLQNIGLREGEDEPAKGVELEAVV